MYVIEGKKIWHTPHGSYEMTKGSCVFARKGATVIEQFFDAFFCVVIFFIPDEFICDVLKTKKIPIPRSSKKFESIIPIKSHDTIAAFYHSMVPYFESSTTPDPSLLELKFRELILALSDNPGNAELHSYFYHLLHQPQVVSLQQVMEDNYCFNLKIEEFARMSNRSLSAFKRDFIKYFGTSPGKWLLKKRLEHGMLLLSRKHKTVNEAAFESGFENPSHFSRSFRQHFGMAPTDVKKKISV